MGVISSLGLAVGCLLMASAQAQQSEWAGLRIANALLAGPASLRVNLNGVEWSKHGMKAGEVSALRRLRPGRHQLQFSCAGLEKHEVRLTLKAGEQITLVPHGCPLPGSPRTGIEVIKLSGWDAGSGRALTVLDLGSQSRRLIGIKQGGKTWTSISLRRKEVQRFEIIQHRGYLPIRLGDRSLGSVPVFGQGNQVLVLYDGLDGQTDFLIYRDRSWPQVDEDVQP